MDQPLSKGAVIFWLIVLSVGLFAAFPYFESVRNANEIPRLLQAVSFVDLGEWTVDGPAARGIDPGPDLAWDKNHKLVPNKPPGTTLFVMAGYWLSKSLAQLQGELPTLRSLTWWSRLLTGLLPTLAICVVAWRRYGSRLGWSVALSASLLYAFATPVASYARLAYGHQLGAAALFIGVIWLLDSRKSASLRPAFFGALFAGFGVAVEYGVAFAGLPIALMLLANLVSDRGDNHRFKRFGVALGGALIPVGCLAAYHDKVFGSPWQTGYHHLVNQKFVENHSEGILGLGLPKWDSFFTHFLSLDAGLLVWSPIVLFAVLGLIQLALDERFALFRSEARLGLAILALYFYIGCSLNFEGGWRIGPRYLVVALPFLILGWAHVVAQLKSTTLWIFFFALFASWSVILNLLAGNLWPHLDPTNIHSPLPELYLPLWAKGYFPYHAFEWPFAIWSGMSGEPLSLMKRAGMSLCVVLPAMMFLGLFLKNVELRMRTVAALLGASAVALTLVFVGSPMLPRHPKGARNLKYIERVYEPKTVNRLPKKTVVLRPLEATPSTGVGGDQ